MRYENTKQLPDTLRDVLPQEAQDMYLEAYQQAWDEYKEERGGQMDRESVAHREGMHAVLQDYTHVNGKWYHRDVAPEEEEQEESVVGPVTHATGQ